MSRQTTKKRQQVRMGGPMGGMGTGEKAKDFKGTVKKLIKYLSDFRWQMLMVLVFAIGSTIFAIASPKILGGATNQIVDDYANMKVYEAITSKLPKGVSLSAGTTGADVLSRLPNKSEIEKQIPSSQLESIKKLDLSRRPEFHFDSIWRIIILLVGMYVLSAIFRYIQTWIMTQVTQIVTFRMRQQLSEKINRLPLSYFDKQTYGETRHESALYRLKKVKPNVPFIHNVYRQGQLFNDGKIIELPKNPSIPPYYEIVQKTDINFELHIPKATKISLCKK